jgi:hypothetical protein
MIGVNTLLSRIGETNNNVLCIYQYGSRVYGTARKTSDYDYIIILKNKTTEQYSDNLINVNYYTQDEHQARLNSHEISALECYHLPSNHILLEKVKFTFKLNLIMLRHSLSAKASNSWVKCKKKLTVPESFDLDVGRKSMFHSFRIIMFGLQVANSGKIYDYSEANLLFEEIMSYYSWDELFGCFKKRYNALMTSFKAVAPK